MEVSQAELEQGGVRDSLLPRPSDIAASAKDSDSDDWRPQDVAGVLLGVVVLALVVLLAVVVTWSAATTLLRHL